MSELISVIIPTYNRAYIIQDSIFSVLNQTYKDIELLVIDDGSTDDTESKVKEIHDNRIRYIKQENKGACAARNKGILLANGKYIAFNDSDDIWYEYKLERQINTLKKYDADIVFCKLDRENYRNGVPSHIHEGFLTQNTDLMGIGTQTLFGKKEIFKDNLFKEDLPRLQDTEILIRLCLKHSIYCMDEKLVKWQLQPNSISKDRDKLYMAVKLILQEDRNYLDCMPNTKGTLLGFLGTCKAYKGVNDPNPFKEAFLLKRRNKDFIKMILAKLGLMTLILEVRDNLCVPYSKAILF